MHVPFGSEMERNPSASTREGQVIQFWRTRRDEGSLLLLFVCQFVYRSYFHHRYYLNFSTYRFCYYHYCHYHNLIIIIIIIITYHRCYNDNEYYSITTLSLPSLVINLEALPLLSLSWTVFPPFSWHRTHGPQTSQCVRYRQTVKSFIALDGKTKVPKMEIHTRHSDSFPLVTAALLHSPPTPSPQTQMHNVHLCVNVEVLAVPDSSYNCLNEFCISYLEVLGST